MGISVEGEYFQRALRGEPVVGREPDPARLTAEDLGFLSTLAWSRRATDSPLRFALREAIRTREPRYDAAAARSALRSLTEWASGAPGEDEPGVVTWMYVAAAQVAYGTDDPAWSEVEPCLRELLSQPRVGAPDPLVAVLLGIAALPAPSLGDTFADEEVGFLCSLRSRADRIAGARAACGWVYATDDDELTPRGSDPLALLPGYLAFAERIVGAAGARLEAIAQGDVPYAADKAFSVAGAQVLRRALLAGLDQGCPWAERAAIALFAGASRAPEPTVSNVPSQSATIAIAKAIAERPSVGLAAALKDELAQVRHAGLQKKVGRLLATAERRIFEHDDFLLARDASEPLPATLRSRATRALELLWLREEALDFEVWRAQFLEAKAIAPLTTALVWTFEDRGALLAIRAGRNREYTDPEGRRVDAPVGRVRLWHPLDAADADAWRRRVIDSGIVQPFNQVFRETYGPESIPALLGPPLDVRTLLGLARAQSWRLSREGCLLRRFGAVRASLDVGRVHPGATGTTVCSAVSFTAAEGGAALPAASVPRRLLSESLRAVDLLVSVAAFALDPASETPGGTARGRRQVLAALVGRHVAGPCSIDGHHVLCGDLKISIATGRATRHGVELAEEESPANLHVLPYADDTLRRIVARLAIASAHARGP